VTADKDPYFGPIGGVLMRKQAGSQARPAEDVPTTPRLAMALDRAGQYTRAMLNDAFNPPQEMRWLVTEDDEGICDTLRGSWETPRGAIDVAHSKHVIMIRLRDRSNQGQADERTRAASAARAIFREGDFFCLVDQGLRGQGRWGMHDRSRTPQLDPDWPHWKGELRWFVEGNDVVFLTLKATGEPTREVISPGAGFNTRWFRDR
jgi:hypothetical protein